jgi:hypothetical protein
MNSYISEEMMASAKAELESCGKSLLASTLDLNVEMIVDIQLEDGALFSNPFLEFLSLGNKSVASILTINNECINFDINNINKLNYRLTQSGMLKKLQFSLKNKHDFVVKVRVKKRLYHHDKTYTVGVGVDIGYEYFWLSGSNYENALLSAFAYVSEYHKRNLSAQATDYRGYATENKYDAKAKNSFFKRLINTIDGILKN